MSSGRAVPSRIATDLGLIVDIALDARARLLAVVCEGGIEVWDLHLSEKVFARQGEGIAASAAFLGDQLGYGDLRGVLHTVSLPDGGSVTTPLGCGPITRVGVVGASGRGIFCVATALGELGFVGLDGPACIPIFDGAPIWAVAGRRGHLAFGSEKGRVAFFEIATGRTELIELDGVGPGLGIVEAIALGSDGLWMVATGDALSLLDGENVRWRDDAATAERHGLGSRTNACRFLSEAGLFASSCGPDLRFHGREGSVRATTRLGEANIVRLAHAAGLIAAADASGAVTFCAAPIPE